MNPQNNHTFSLADLRNDVVGIDTVVPLLNGTERRYVFLDNAASTPTFKSVLKRIEEFMPWYSGVHRGMGYKAMVATDIYEHSHRIAGEFVGADLNDNVVLFGKNTTEQINQLAKHFNFNGDDIIISTRMEHHSNDLPWRRFGNVVHVGILQDGSINMGELKEALKEHSDKVRLVAVTGASNVTGICNPVHDIAELAHKAGAKIFVDAAQLVPHRPVNMLPNSDPRHLDFLAFSAHKVYAPFGTGVLIGPKEFFDMGEPDFVGGGTVSYVGLDEVKWGSLPQKEEAGSPNVVGAVALAEVLSILSAIGMEKVAAHEQELLAYAYSKLKTIPGIQLYGPTEDFSGKVGVIAFNIEGIDHAFVATVLSIEGGIGVRNGNFCAQPYVRSILNVTPEEEKLKRAATCNNPILPGMVRASFGCYNNKEDIDIFIESVERLSRHDYRGVYKIDQVTGMYVADTFHVIPSKHFSFTSSTKIEA